MPVFSKQTTTTHEKPEKEADDVLSPFYFPPPEDQLNQKEVAEMFSTTVQTVNNWQKAGKIPVFHLGKHPIYSRKLLIYYARNNRNLMKQ